MAVRSRSKARALARNGMLSSNAASRVRRTIPRTDWCQPAACFTRPARPPRPPRRPWPPRDAPRAPRDAAAAHRAPAAAAPFWPWTRPPGPRAPSQRDRPAHRLFPRRASSGHRACATPYAGCSTRLPARTGIPPPRPPRARPETHRTRSPRRRRRLHARSFARLEVVRRVGGHRPRPRVGLQRRFDVAVHRRPRAGHAQLLEQERERLLQVGADRLAHLRGQIPQPALERSHRLLAALIDELLLRVPLLPLVLALLLHPLVDLGAQVGGEPGMVEHDGLEVGREVDLDRLTRREIPERVGRQRGRAVLHRAAESVFGPRVAR